MGPRYKDDFEEIMRGEEEFTYLGEEEFTPEPKRNYPEDEDDEDEEPERRRPKKGAKPKVKKKASPKSKPKSSTKKSSGSDNKQFVAKIIVTSLIISGGLLFWKFGPLNADNSGEEQQIADSSTEEDNGLPKLSDTPGVTEGEGGTSEDSPNPDSSESTEPSVTMEDAGINPGLSDFESGDRNTNTGEVTETGDFLKDINGSQIPKHYEVKKINYETDFVSYTKKRGVTADGVELLWLDAEYKGNPYVIQVPFRIWKELDETGITVVDMEVLTIDKNLRVISNMQVKDNYKEIMEKGEKALKKDK